MTTPKRPIIFLAFANDRSNSTHYLRNLPQEARALQASLTQAEQSDLCKVVVQQNAILNDILDTFQDARYCDSIAIFHFGGHANGYQLLFETADGKTAGADAAGLAAFLAQQRGLQLVFLNGCSTQQQVEGLLDAGVAVVIATAQAIDDTVATEFSTRFYQGLADGHPIQRAFKEAEAALQMDRGCTMRAFYYGDPQANEPPIDRWPWMLYSREGAEQATAWNLPSAAHNPLFGLPALPKLDPPERPFRHLEWFRRVDAPIFFGRGYQIRDLYARITDANSAPLLLLYGQSGVGKSSLLAAGLQPRLEQVQTVIYLRRSQEKGLLGALLDELTAWSNPAVAQAQGQPMTPLAPPAPSTLLACWLQAEQASGKPLTVILDQIEELYTRPQGAPQAELEPFLKALVETFVDRSRRPRGKLICSFRKEWLAEINEQMACYELPRSTFFLERLNRLGIIEAVTGVANTPALQRHYGLTVQDDLATEIADDLLVDHDAAIAPMLQILLAKLWERAQQRANAQPRFDQELYHQLRTEGLLLGDFLDKQFIELERLHPAPVQSGLALDLLAFHTTTLGTAEEHTEAELQSTYPHPKVDLRALLSAARDLYLLVDPPQDQQDPAHTSRLAHDTLAPLVRSRFDESDRPGQRARRILESRIPPVRPAPPGQPAAHLPVTQVRAGTQPHMSLAPVNGSKPAASLEGLLAKAQFIAALPASWPRATTERIALSPADLKQVEAGETGMRQWTEAEKQLVKVSRAARRTRRITFGLLVLVAFVAISIIIGQRDGAWVTLYRAQTTEAEALAAQALNQLDSNPLVSAHLAAQGLPVAASRPYAPAAESAYTAALNNLWEIGQSAGGGALQRDTQIARQGDLLAVGSDQLWIGAGAELQTEAHMPAERKVLGVAWNQANELLSFTEQKLQLWQRFGQDKWALGKSITAPSNQGKVTCAEWDPAGGQVAVCQFKTLALWNPQAASFTALYTFTTPVVGDVDHRRTRWSPNGHWLAAWDANRTLLLTTGNPNQTLVREQVHRERIWDIAWSPDERYLVTVSGDRTAKLWGASDLQLTATVSLTASAPKATALVEVAGATFLDAQHFLTWGFDGVVREWNIAGEPLYTYGASNGVVTGIQIEQDESGSWLFSFLDNGRVLRWNLRDPNASVLTLRGEGQRVLKVAQRGDYLATANLDGTVRIWNVATGGELALLIGHQPASEAGRSDVLDLFWQDAQHLATVGMDGTIRRWRFVTDRDPFCTGRGSDQPMRCYGLSHVVPISHTTILAAQWVSDTALVGVDGAKNVFFWAEGQRARPLLPPGEKRQVWLSPDGAWLFTTPTGAGGAKEGALWSVLEGGQPITFTGPISAVQWVGGAVLISRPATPPLLFTPATRAQTAVGQPGTVYRAADLAGDHLATAAQDGMLRIWQPSTGGQTGEWRTTEPGAITQVAWQDAGQHLLTVTNRGALALWDVNSGQALWRFHALTATVSSLAFSPDARLLAVALDRSFFVLDATNGQEQWRFTNPKGTVAGLRWVARGQWAQLNPSLSTTYPFYRLFTGDAYQFVDPGLLLATWGGDGEVHFWHWASHVEILRLRENPMPNTTVRWPINSVALSQDLARIVAAGDSGELHIWQIWLNQPEKLFGVLQARGQ